MLFAGALGSVAAILVFSREQRVLWGGMETKNIAEIDLQKEYLRTLQAVRIAAIVLLVLCAGWCWQQYCLIDPPVGVLENVIGQPNFTPRFVSWIDSCAIQLGGIATMALSASLLYMVLAGRTISRVVYATIIGAGTCAAVGQLFSTAAMEAWREIARILNKTG